MKTNNKQKGSGEVVAFIIAGLIVASLVMGFKGWSEENNKNIGWCEAEGGRWISTTRNSHCAFIPDVNPKNND